MSKVSVRVVAIEDLPTDPEKRGAAASEAIRTLSDAQAPYYDVRHDAIIAMLEGAPQADPPRPPMRPADVARTIGVTRAFMSRYKDVQPK